MTGIEPFEIAIPQGDLDDLTRRLQQTRWPEDIANDDWSYGANTAYIRALTDYWLHHYNWREREALMNSFAQFRTDIDGLPIHFIHEKGKGPNATPLVLSHGWPWTFWDYHKVIGPLTDPAAYGGDPADAFDVIVPSLPGYGFSTPLTVPGVNWWKTSAIWVKLMDRLGYDRFGAHGGDWGSFISAELGHRFPERMTGVHLSTPAPLNFMSGGEWDPEDYTPEEQEKLTRMAAIRGGETGYFLLQATKPQTIATALADSPVGLLAWIVEKRRSWSDCSGDVESRFTPDELIDTVMLYWLTNSYHTSARYYAEGMRDPWRPAHAGTPVVSAPTGLAIFPAELTHPTRRWAERTYNLQQWTEMPSGGHFAPMEEPELLVKDIRSFFPPLR